LEDEQLLEGQPRPCTFRVLERARTVECMERVATRRQSLVLLERSGQRIGNVARQRGQDELAKLLRSHVLAGGIDGHELCVS
jgi:hypothetical protein